MGSSPSCSTTSSTATRTPRSTRAVRRRCSKPCGCCARSARSRPSSRSSPGWRAASVPASAAWCRPARATCGLPRRAGARGGGHLGPETFGTPGAATLTVDFCGIELAAPIINGSGTFDAIAARRAFGDELLDRFPFAAFVSKTVTLAPRQGNPPPRLWELPGGADELDRSAQQGTAWLSGRGPPGVCPSFGVPLIVNVMGFSREEVAELVRAFADARRSRGARAKRLVPERRDRARDGRRPGRDRHACSRAVRPLTDKPLIVKLTPNANDPAAVAYAAQEGGASAVSLINTLRGMAFAPGHRSAVARWRDRRRLGAGGRAPSRWLRSAPSAPP